MMANPRVAKAAPFGAGTFSIQVNGSNRFDVVTTCYNIVYKIERNNAAGFIRQMRGPGYESINLEHNH